MDRQGGILERPAPSRLHGPLELHKEPRRGRRGLDEVRRQQVELHLGQVESVSGALNDGRPCVGAGREPPQEGVRIDGGRFGSKRPQTAGADQKADDDNERPYLKSAPRERGFVEGRGPPNPYWIDGVRALRMWSPQSIAGRAS